MFDLSEGIVTEVKRGFEKRCASHKNSRQRQRASSFAGIED